MKTETLYPETTSRRGFVKMGAAGGTTALAVSTASAKQADDKVDVWVLHGTDNRKLMQKAMNIVQENGWFGKDVKTVALKVNAAWSRTPEQGANTHPDLVDVFIEGAKKGGVKNVILPEHPCNAAKIAFDMSGIKAAVKKHKSKLIDLKTKKSSFKEVAVPEGRTLKTVEIADEFLTADAVVNIPVAKHHKATKLSCAMKNWLGAIEDRRHWHRTDLHQCIADFCTVMKPAWTIIDATRCMMDSGPQGPAKELKTPDLLIISKDQVAADAYASSIFLDSPYEIKYLKYAEEMGIGVADHDKMNIHKIEVS